MLFDDIPLNDISPDAVDKTGQIIPPGKYHARLNGAGDTTSKNGTQGTELTFVVLTGPFAGQEVEETLWNSDNDKVKNRLVLFGHRLGVLHLNPATKKYELAKDKHTFQDVIGAECVIEITHREYEKKDSSGKVTGKGVAANVSFGGIWKLDDAAVKDVAKAKAGSKPPAAPAKPKIDTSGI